ncbi:hypothetical protein JCM21900_005702 [Sporobolomyces salmonicolor]
MISDRSGPIPPHSEGEAAYLFPHLLLSLPLQQATLRQQLRSLHVDNVVNNNFPFKYEGAKSKAFTVGLITVIGTGASLPFAVAAYQIWKASA